MAINQVNGDTMTSNVNENPNVYSIPLETRHLFHQCILDNPLVAPTLPGEIEERAITVRFEGTSESSIPINWRLAESVSALKGLEAAMINVLLKRKFGLEPQEAVINTQVTPSPPNSMPD
jgi:hypothetical protein